LTNQRLNLGWFGALTAWINPAVPEEIRGSLQRAQFDSVRRQVPMLLFVALLNTVIIMAVCAHDDLPFKSYGWMLLIIFYCLIRLIIWSRVLKKHVETARIPHLLKMNVGVTLVMISVLGIDAAITFLAGMFNSQMLIPVSLSFGAMAIAHCLYSLRPAAIGAVVMGLFPSSLAMLVKGNFEAQMLGLSTISVGLLMIRFVSQQYEQLIQSLLLEDENRRLALSDPLTGLANRRAVMAALDEAAVDDGTFGVALLDLDGFKEVNDELGHHAGDLMLQLVGERLSGAALPGDLVGRLGGDEFILLLRGVTDDAEMSSRTTAMLAALCRPVDIEGHVVPVAASLGFARSLGDGQSVTILLRTADSALYSAKGKAKRAPLSRQRAA
jgi:diguanylate cyclase